MNSVIFIHGITKTWQKTWGGSDKSRNRIRYIAKQSRGCRITAFGLNVLQVLEEDIVGLYKAADALVDLLRENKQVSFVLREHEWD